VRVLSRTNPTEKSCFTPTSANHCDNRSYVSTIKSYDKCADSSFLSFFQSENYISDRIDKPLYLETPLLRVKLEIPSQTSRFFLSCFNKTRKRLRNIVEVNFLRKNKKKLHPPSRILVLTPLGNYSEIQSLFIWKFSDIAPHAMQEYFHMRYLT
jgi:hypothetical protein